MTSPPRKKMRKSHHNGGNFFTESEDKEMVRFWVRYVRKEQKKESIRSIWTKFLDESGSERSISSLNSRFRVHVAPKIWKMLDLDLDSIVKVLFVSRSQVEKEYLKELERFSKVELDDKNLILRFSDPRPGGMHLVYEPPNNIKNRSNRRKTKYPAESSDSEDDDDVIVEGKVPMPIPMGPIKYEQEEYPDSESYLTTAWNPRIENLNRNQYQNQMRNSEDGEMMASREMVMFATSLKEMFDQQAAMMKELVQEAKQRPSSSSSPHHRPSSKSASRTSLTIPPSTSNSSFSLQSTAPATSSSINNSRKGFLHLLRNLVLSMDNSDLEPIRRKISREILKMGDKDENLPANSIKLALESVLNIIN